MSPASEQEGVELVSPPSNGCHGDNCAFEIDEEERSESSSSMIKSIIIQSIIIIIRIIIHVGIY